MKRKITLRIGGTPEYLSGTVADLGEDSFVLLNWSNGDLTEPAQIKNSWSRQITLPGTPTNDNIFGHAWRLDRNTSYDISDNVGIFFDAARRTPFTIHDETSAVIESGYLKLDGVDYDGPRHSYKVTLFGGLGGFLYSLSYTEAGTKKTLADLVYKAHDGTVQDLDYTISQDTVSEAWEFLAANTGPHYLQNNKWDFINFATAYNGFPKGLFSADKAIADVQLSGLPFIDGDYKPLNNGRYVLVSFPEKKTEWETRDLRSYLQRPVFRLGAILEAIANPENNGGYEVELDETIFDPVLAQNDYVWGTWLTLPLMTDLNVHRDAGGDVSFSVATGQNTIPATMGAASSFRLQIAPKIGPGSAARYLNVGGSYIMNWIEVVVQFYKGGVIQRILIKRFGSVASDDPDVPEISNVGHFDASGNWVGDPAVFEWSNIAGIGNETYDRVDISFTNGGNRPACTGSVWTDQSNVVTISAYTASLVASAKYNLTAVDGVRSFMDVHAYDLLRGSKTPADYLLSFCKMLGLRMIFDPARKKITITSRYSYYSGRSSVTDISARINRGKPMTQTPLTFDKRWYSFALDYSRGEWAQYYANKYGIPYGSRRVDTGYEFDAGTHDVMSGLAFRGAVQILEPSKFYMNFTSSGVDIPGVFLDNGATYDLFNTAGDSKQMAVPVPAIGSGDPINAAATGFDLFDKPQFHGEDNAPYDERDTLVFFAGIENVTAGKYRISDDSSIMMSLNNNAPCWTLASGIPINTIPHFSRYGNYYNGMYYVSLDFGIPAEIPAPDLTFANQATIYERSWQAFISDRLDSDTTVVRCHVNLDGLGRVGQDLLRKFYYFDGSIWSLNKIINYSLTTWDDTECEFVRVQNVNNY